MIQKTIDADTKPYAVDQAVAGSFDLDGTDGFTWDEAQIVQIDNPPHESAFDTDRFYKIDATLARPVEQTYQTYDGEVVMKKPAAELRQAAWSFDNAPVTLGHPSTQIVDSVDLVHGFARNPRWNDDDGALRASLYVPVTDAEAKAWIEDNDGVSIGFWNEPVDPDGDTDVDRHQTNLYGDHIAIVEEGRCSREDGCGLAVDGSGRAIRGFAADDGAGGCSSGPCACGLHLDADRPEQHHYDTREAAAEAADRIGCDGTHTHETDDGTIYMPCDSHEEFEAHADLTEDVDQDELDEVYSEWSDATNMTAAQLREWSENPCSRQASQNPTAVIERNLELLETDKDDWTASHVRDARRTISFIERMNSDENRPDSPADGAHGCPSDWAISLLNWAHNPFDSLPGGPDEDAGLSDVSEITVDGPSDWGPDRHETDYGYVNLDHQTSDGTSVTVDAASAIADFWLSVYLEGSEYEVQNASLSSSIGETGPFDAGTVVEDVTIELDEHLGETDEVFVTLHYDDDGEKGPHIESELGFIFDSAVLTVEETAATSRRRDLVRPHRDGTPTADVARLEKRLFQPDEHTLGVTLDSSRTVAGVTFSGVRDGKLDEAEIPTDDFASHYLYPGDTKSESSYPVVDAEGFLRAGNVEAAHSLGARGGVDESEHASNMERLNEVLCDSDVGCAIDPETFTEDMTYETDADSYSEGDWVEWDWSGGTAVGRVQRREDNGSVSVEGGTREGTPDNPAYLIEHWDDGSFGNDTVKLHSELRSADEPADFDTDATGHKQQRQHMTDDATLLGVEDLTLDAVADKHDEVAELVEQRNELADKVEVLNDRVETLEEEVETYRADEKQSLVEEITQITSAWDESELLDMSLDEVEEKLDVARDIADSVETATVDSGTDGVVGNTPTTDSQETEYTPGEVYDLADTA